MPAGKLKDWAVFQVAGKVPDGLGGHTDQWIDFLEVPAALMLGSVAERLAASRLEATGKAMIRVRKSDQAAEIAPAMRVIVSGVTYQIRGWPQDPYRDGQWLDIEIESGVAS